MDVVLLTAPPPLEKNGFSPLKDFLFAEQDDGFEDGTVD